MKRLGENLLTTFAEILQPKRIFLW